MGDEQKPNYSPDNWAHKALLLMDDADALVIFAAVNMLDADKYTKAAKAFWDVCRMLADERDKLHNVRSQATDAALSRQVACTDGLGVAVPPAPTFEQGD